MTEPRKRIGNTDVVVTRELLARLRGRMKELSALGNTLKIIEAIAPEFPEMSSGSVENYVYSLRSLSDYVFGLYMDGKISANVLSEIGQAKLDPATKDFIAGKVVELRLTLTQVAVIKGELKRKGQNKCSLAEAIKRATGEIPAHSRREDIAKSVKQFGGIVEDVSQAAMTFMVKFKQAVDLLPLSVLDRGEAHMALLEKVYVFEASLENVLRFVAEKKKRYVKEIVDHVSTEAQLESARLEGGKANGEPPESGQG